MIYVINALMESHTLAKYGTLFSEGLGLRAVGIEQVHSEERKSCICIAEEQFKFIFMQKHFQYLSRISVTKQ